MSNQILPFCPTDTGTNLLSQVDYAAAADRSAGNQPGVASSKLNNKAMRQATFVASQFAQLIANLTGTSVLDDGVTAKLLAQFTAALTPYAPNITPLLSGSGTFNLTYIFHVASANATVGATYTNNAFTFTVKATIAGAVLLYATGPGVPLANGTLTKASGTGDATITFYAVRAPIALEVVAVGGGGGGAGGGTASQTAGGAGGNTTFGTTLIVANGGAGAGTTNVAGGAGGSASLGTGPVGLALSGARGGPGLTNASAGLVLPGGGGGTTPLGGAGATGAAAGGNGTDGSPGIVNTGSGGGGASCGNTPNAYTGAGGGAGGYVKATLTGTALLSTFTYAVGAAGTAGALGTNGAAGAAGGSGALLLTEIYQ